MLVIRIINDILISIIALSYIYQLTVILCSKNNNKQNKNIENHKFALLIAARNEENVIGNLIDSIKLQKYPKELIDIFVVADNCTDSTADIARKKGTIVFERSNEEEIGKGYALDFLIKKINNKYKDNKYDAFIIFDADDILDENCIFEMNKMFSNGFDVVAGHINPINYGKSWISSGSGIWFLHESLYLKFKTILNKNYNLSGTGLLVSSNLLKYYGGWKFHLLTEDIEFSTLNYINNIKCGYSDLAIIYDEQPVSFKDYYKQRLRWTKGTLQVYKKYGSKKMKKTISSFCSNLNIFSKDISTIVMGLNIINIITIIVISFIILVNKINNNLNENDYFKLFIECIIYSYLISYIMGIIPVVVRWKNIKENVLKKIIYTFTFPIIYVSYIPIMIIALFKKVVWKPIKHNG